MQYVAVVNACESYLERFPRSHRRHPGLGGVGHVQRVCLPSPWRKANLLVLEKQCESSVSSFCTFRWFGMHLVRCQRTDPRGLGAPLSDRCILGSPPLDHHKLRPSERVFFMSYFLYTSYLGNFLVYDAIRACLILLAF